VVTRLEATRLAAISLEGTKRVVLTLTPLTTLRLASRDAADDVRWDMHSIIVPFVNFFFLKSSTPLRNRQTCGGRLQPRARRWANGQWRAR
jgi:hypothetical protein